MKTNQPDSSTPAGRLGRLLVARDRPVAALWLVWLVLAGAVYANPVRSAITLLFDPAAGDTVFDQGIWIESNPFCQTWLRRGRYPDPLS